MNPIWVTTLIVLKFIAVYFIPIIFSLHTWLYAKNPKYYFFIVRIFSKWRDTTWSVNATYVLPELGDSYLKIETILKRMYKDGRYKRTVNMSNKKLYECDIFNILIQDDFNSGDISSRTMFIKISQLNVTLNTAEEKLRDLREMFHAIEREIKIESSGYALDVYFKKGNNPFFGLMVQRLGKNNISHFECRFPISAIITKKSGIERNDHFLRIYKEKLCINESSFAILEETARRALLFK